MGASILTSTVDRLGHFLGEAARRRVWRSALAYGAVVFVLLQLAEIVLPAFNAPPWALRLLVMASFLGLPPVLCLAWVFDVTAGGIQRTDGESPPEGSPEGDRRFPAALPRLALLAVTLAIVGGLGWWTVQDTVAATPAAGSGGADPSLLASAEGEAPLEVRSLAVLPLDDYGQEEGGEFFTAGFHEELIAQLSRIGSARVVSRTSVVSYDRTGKSMPTIAEELGVEGVVEGSVFRDGDRVRITVQLIYGPEDRHLWANSYDGTLDDAIALQEEIAGTIAQEIQAQLFPGRRLTGQGERIALEPRAETEYRKGRMEQARATPEGLAEAVHHYRAALEEDSSFAPAFAGLAAVRFLQGVQAADSVSPALFVDPEVVEPLQAALRLDRGSPEARAVLVKIQEIAGRMPELDLPEGIHIVLDSSALQGTELREAARELTQQVRIMALERGPDALAPEASEGRLTAARHLQMKANFRDAESVVRTVVREDPAAMEAWDALAGMRVVRGDYRGAVEVWREQAAVMEDQRAQASAEALEARVEAEGEAGYWRWRLQELERRQERGQPVSLVEMARANLGLGHTDQALALLEEARKTRDRNLINLWTDPAWERLRADPRFGELLAELRREGGVGLFLP